MPASELVDTRGSASPRPTAVAASRVAGFVGVRPLGHQRVDLVDQGAEIVVQPIARMGKGDRDLGGDAAGIGRQHENAVGHQHRFLDIMGDHQDGLDRHAPLLPKIEQIGAQGLGGKHVEGRERLVHQQDLRLHDESPREADALAHAARQLLWVGGFKSVEADGVDRFQRALPRLVERNAVGAGPDLDIVEDVEPGEKREALKHHRDFLGRSVHRLAVDLHRALRRSRETGDEPQKSRLAGSRAAEQRNDLAGLQAHGNVAQHRRARFSRTCRENLAYLVDVQDRRDGGVQHGLKLPINDAVRGAAAAPRRHRAVARTAG